jgi:hypothetical protein
MVPATKIVLSERKQYKRVKKWENMVVYYSEALSQKQAYGAASSYTSTVGSGQ